MGLLIFSPDIVFQYHFLNPLLANHLGLWSTAIGLLFVTVNNNKSPSAAFRSFLWRIRGSSTFWYHSFNLDTAWKMRDKTEASGKNRSHTSHLCQFAFSPLGATDPKHWAFKKCNLYWNVSLNFDNYVQCFSINQVTNCNQQLSN